MSAGCVRWVLSRTVRAVCAGTSHYWTPASRFTICSERLYIISSSRRWSPFSTTVDDTQQTPPTKKKNKNAHPPITITTVGRTIPHDLMQVISDTGDSLGTMNREDALKIMDQQGLKLVLLKDYEDPPVYGLMTSKKIHEEQVKLREKQKAKVAATVQVKQLTFSFGISAHDLTTKLKRVESWLEKKHHVRITLRPGQKDPVVNLDTALQHMVQQLQVMVGFVAKPRTINNGQAAMCVLRPPSAKELGQMKKAAERKSDSSKKATPKKTSPVSDTDTTEGSTPQCGA